MHGNDWKLLLKAVHPQGDVCIENNERVIRGPLEKVYVDERDNVVITVKWSGIKKLVHVPSTPDTRVPETVRWSVHSPRSMNIFTFPNMTVPYRLLDKPGDGICIIFSGKNRIYLDDVRGIQKEDVDGWILAE